MRLTCLFFPAVAAAGLPSKPNIVFFLTDDQDQVLGGSFPPTAEGGATPMPQTQRLLAEEGTMATNWFIHTPICCPSRAELLSGRYFHNIKRTGGGCMHVDVDKVNNATFARVLSEQGGYKVGMFGKYLNNVPKDVPPGFDAWLANGGGDYISPSFATLNIDGLPDGHWTGSKDNYSTSVIGNTSIAWIRKQVAAGHPFFAYVAPKAAHEPFNPAVWYADHWDAAWPAHEPRPPNWNISAARRRDHHGNIATQPMLTEAAAAVITDVFKNRWRTLMSVDDAIAAVVAACASAGVGDSTYYFYTSDHGFQLGEFNIPMDKRHVYDWDTRIHLLARGPGISAGTQFSSPGTQVDLAPTFLGLAGIAKPAIMDGESIVPLIVHDGPQLLGATRRHLASLGTAASYVASWRTEVFIEYYFVEDNDKCVEGCKPGDYPKEDTWCGDLAHNNECWGPAPRVGCNSNCYPTESDANNFIALRTMPGSPFGDAVYAEFQTGSQSNVDIDFSQPDFFELYDYSNDPWAISNVYNSTAPTTVSAMRSRLHRWSACSGASCAAPTPQPGPPPPGPPAPSVDGAYTAADGVASFAEGAYLEVA